MPFMRVRYAFALLCLTPLVMPTATAAVPEFVGRLATIVEPTILPRLELSPEVQAKLLQLIDERETKATDLAQQVKNLPAAEREEKLAPYRAESERLGMALLTAAQLKRLEQLEWEQRGPLSFDAADVAAKLKLTPQQVEQIQALKKEFQSRAGEGDAGTRNARQAELERTVLSLLQPEQRAGWEQLIGRAVAEHSATPTNNTESTTPPMVVSTESSASKTDKSSESSTGSTTVAEPGTVAKGTETKAPDGKPIETKPIGDKKLRFSFKYQPWREVIEWFAGQSDLSLIMDDSPPGTLNYSDPKYYSPAEALDLLNGILQTKGYMLIRRERMLMVVNMANGIPAGFVENIKPEELDKRAQYELVSCLFKLERAVPDKIAAEIKPLLGPQGTSVVLVEAKQLLVTDTAGRLRVVRGVIDAIERPAGETADSFKPLALKHIAPAEALTIVKQLMNIPSDRNSLPDGSLRLVADTVNKSLLVGGKADLIARVEEILTLVDVPNEAGAGLLEGTPQLEVYSIGAADSQTVLQVLQTILSGLPDVRLSLDPRNGNLIALARPSQHATIRATIEQFQRDARQLEVYRLRMLDPTVVKEAIAKLFEGDGGSGAPKVEADATLRQLVVRASPTQLTQIKQLLEKMGEGDFTTELSTQSGLDSNVQLLPLNSRAAMSVLGQIEQVWPTLHKNKIRIVTPSQLNGTQPSAVPQPSPTGMVPMTGELPSLIQQKRLNESPAEASETAPSGQPGAADQPGIDVGELLRRLQNAPAIAPPKPAIPQQSPPPAKETSAPITTDREQHRSAGLPRKTVIRTAAFQQPTGEQAPAAPLNPNAEAPPIMISIGPAGMLVACEDKEVLADFLNLAKSLAARQNNSQKEYTVYYLKYAKAQVVAELLEQIFASGGSSSSGGSGLLGSLAGAAFGDFGGGLMGNLLGLGGGGGESAPVMSSGSGTIQIVPEARLNALIVQAGVTDLDTIEQLLKVIDQADSPEELALVSKPRLIPVLHTQAEEIAAVVKQVYADRVAGGASAQRQPSPEEFIQALRGGNSRGGNNRRRTEETQKMSIGVDSRTNSLVVTATDDLFVEVKELVTQLDVETVSGNETMKIVSLKNASPAMVQQALQQIVGPENLKNATATTGSAGSAGTSSARSNRNLNSTPNSGGASGFDPNMMRMLQGGGGRSRGGSSGGFPGSSGFGSGGFGGGRGGR